VRDRDLLALGVLLARMPFPLEVVTAGGRLVAVPDPARLSLRVDQDIRPDDFRSLIPKGLHQQGVAFVVHILNNAEDADLGIDGPKCSIVCDPHLGQVIADEVGPDHGRGGLATTAWRRAGEESHAAARPAQSGDEHMLGELALLAVVCAEVHGKAVIALLEQQCIAGVRAEQGKGGQPASIHEHPGVGQILSAVWPFAVNVGEEDPGPFHLFVK